MTSREPPSAIAPDDYDLAEKLGRRETELDWLKKSGACRLKNGVNSSNPTRSFPCVANANC
jgi:hypothetical protein